MRYMNENSRRASSARFAFQIVRVFPFGRAARPQLQKLALERSEGSGSCATQAARAELVLFKLRGFGQRSRFISSGPPSSPPPTRSKDLSFELSGSACFNINEGVRGSLGRR